MFELVTSYLVKFTDCSFMGMYKEDISENKKLVKYSVFSNLNLGHSIIIENCFFRGIESVYKKNQPPRSLEIINSSFEGMNKPCLQISNPDYLLVSGCNFFNI